MNSWSGSMAASRARRLSITTKLSSSVLIRKSKESLCHSSRYYLLDMVSIHIYAISTHLYRSQTWPSPSLILLQRLTRPSTPSSCTTVSPGGGTSGDVSRYNTYSYHSSLYI